MFEGIITVFKGINTAFETLGHFTKLRQHSLNKLSGSELFDLLNQGKAISNTVINTGAISGDVNTSSITLPTYNFFLSRTNSILSNPEQYHLEKIHPIQRLSRSQLSQYLQTNQYMSTVIIPDGKNNYFIGEMPSPIARHAFIRGINHTLDEPLFDFFGFKLHYPDVPESKHISALPLLDQIYFVQLYKDYRQLKIWARSTPIKSFDDFVQSLYQQKIHLETTEGWDNVLFELTTRPKGNSVAVGTVPVKKMSK